MKQKIKLRNILIIMLLALFLRSDSLPLKIADQSDPELASREILSYVLLMVHNGNPASEETKTALENIAEIYQNMDQKNPYFESKKLSKVIMRSIHKNQIERKFIKYNYLERDALFEKLVRFNQFNLASQFYSNDIYSLVKISKVFSQNGEHKRAYDYLTLAYYGLIEGNDSSLRESLLPLIIESYINLDEYDNALYIATTNPFGDQEYYFIAQDLAAEGQIDKALEMTSLIKQDRSLQVEALINIAVKLADSKIVLRQEEREILKQILIAALKQQFT